MITNKSKNKNNPDVSLIIACYNESEHLNDSIQRLICSLSELKSTYELIIIDDKSSDNTVQLIKELARKYPVLKVFYHKNNQGRGATVQEGIIKAKANIVGFIDIDLEIGPDYIPQFANAIKSNVADIVIARRYYPFHLYPVNYLIREILSRGYVSLVKLLLRLPIQDTEAGYKFFNKEKIMPLLDKIQDRRWFWDTEIVARSFMYGLRVKQLPVLFLRRNDKTSTVKLIPDTIEYMKAINKFKKSLKLEYELAPGWLYQFPNIYPIFMKFIYSKNYTDRYVTIAEQIELNSTVIDVCCGDSVLFNYLKSKNVSYFGLDINPAFVISGINKGLNIRLSDVEKETIPPSDYIIMQASLYQFSDPGDMIKKLHQSAKKTLIISEPIQNLNSSLFFSQSILKALSAMIVGTRNKDPHFRFNEENFKTLLNKYNPTYIKIPGGRELIAIIKK